MSEEIAAAEKVAGKGKKKADAAAASPEDAQKTADLHVARALVRAVWQVEYNAANPGANGADRAAAWKEARAERLQAHLKNMRMVVRQLSKQGINFVSEASATDADAETYGSE